MKLTILSGGAANGLVAALGSQLKAETGADIDGTFGAVGAMRDKLIAGASADLVILTSALIAELTKAGHVEAGSAADLGAIATGVAVRDRDPAPAIGDADTLRAALRAADGIYFPDPKLATAGIHFARCWSGSASPPRSRRACASSRTARPRWRRFAAQQDGRPIGCTRSPDSQHPGRHAGRQPAAGVRARNRLHARHLRQGAVR